LAGGRGGGESDERDHARAEDFLHDCG
jgi:hypothetical protein